MFGRMQDDTGSAAAEFTMVAALLTVLALAVIQLALALHIRNTVLDAAAEGARYAALADTGLADGRQRTRDLISVAIGPSYARHISANYVSYLGHQTVAVTVRSPLPLIGLFGIESGLEVTGHASLETVER